MIDYQWIQKRCSPAGRAAVSYLGRYTRNPCCSSVQQQPAPLQRQQQQQEQQRISSRALKISETESPRHVANARLLDGYEETPAPFSPLLICLVYDFNVNSSCCLLSTYHVACGGPPAAAYAHLESLLDLNASTHVSGSGFFGSVCLCPSIDCCRCQEQQAQQQQLLQQQVQQQRPQLQQPEQQHQMPPSPGMPTLRG